MHPMRGRLWRITRPTTNPSRSKNCPYGQHPEKTRIGCSSSDVAISQEARALGLEPGPFRGNSCNR